MKQKMTDRATKINVFIAYAREDAAYLKELRKQLRILERSKQVDKIWYDGEIVAGQEWEKEIKNAMKTADIFLLLLSADFINSDYCYGVEMEEALTRHEAGTSTIIPIVLRDCGWHYTPLSKIQAPVSGQAIAGNTYKDALYKGIVDAIAKVAKTTRERKKTEAPKPKVQKAKPIKLTKKQNKEDIKQLLLDKILFLQKERILATDASVKFKLKHEIAELEEELANSNGTTQVENIITATKFDFSTPEMVFVKGDYMKLGRNAELEVNMSDFKIGKYAVTNEEFCAFLNAKGNQKEGGVEWMLENESSKIKSNRNKFTVEKGYKRHPVINVSWYAANAYAKWLSDQTTWNFHLPSETQWEYATRGGQKTKDYQYAGSNDVDKVAWYADNSGGKLHEVGQKASNELELYDMSGNVWEWCGDIWNDDFANAPKDGSVSLDGNSTLRVLRGGSWYNNDGYTRVSFRDRNYASIRIGYIGFRIAQD